MARLSYSTIRAVIVDLVAYRGDKSTYLIGFFTDKDLTQPFDLSGMTGTLKMQIKRSKNEPRIVGELDETTGLTIGLVNTNELTIESSGINTDRPAFDYFYDVEGVDTGVRLTFLAGQLVITEDVTR